jgi:hypothetical protein
VKGAANTLGAGNRKEDAAPGRKIPNAGPTTPGIMILKGWRGHRVGVNPGMVENPCRAGDHGVESTKGRDRHLKR